VKISFIRPHLWDARSADAMQPLVFSLLAALTPPQHEITLIDERLEPVDFEHEADLVAITVETYTARRAYEISRRFRQRGIPVVMGGYHPTLLPAEAMHYADAIVVGDAEGIWPRVLDDAEQGRLRACYSNDEDPPLAGLVPDRSIFQGKKYSRLVPVYYGRGCRFACDFCSIYSFYQARLRQRPIDELTREIEALQSKYILFVDDNLFVNGPVTRRFLQAIRPLDIQWVCQVSIDIARDPQLLDLMAASGCRAAQIGFESLDENNLVQMKKKWNLKYGDYQTSIAQIQDRGIMVYGSFVLGYDHDTVDSFAITVDFALENNFCLANFNPLTPMPGSGLYARARDAGRLVYEHWWLDPAYRYGDATLYPKRMTPQQLTEGCYWARNEFLKYGAILKRAFDSRVNHGSLANLGIVLAANTISRKEIRAKQGRPLGARQPITGAPPR